MNCNIKQFSCYFLEKIGLYYSRLKFYVVTTQINHIVIKCDLLEKVNKWSV